MVRQECQAQADLVAQQVLPALPESLVQQAQLVTRVQQVRLAQPELQVRAVLADQQFQPESLVRQVQPVQLE